MLWNGSAVTKRIDWVPVHGGRARIDAEGALIFGDSPRSDWHLLRWSDPRLEGARVKISLRARPTPLCDTEITVHHWGGRDICSISREGIVVLNNGAQDVAVGRRADGLITATLAFPNRHATLHLGTGKPGGVYRGTGSDQYRFERIDVELLPINRVHAIVVDRLWAGRDPFWGMPTRLFRHDLQGWNGSQHPYLERAVTERHPSLIVEVGVWKGGSTAFMAKGLKEQCAQSVIIAIDTWLGSSEHWLGPWRRDLNVVNGYPHLYYTFLGNILTEGLCDYVVPLPLDSLNAATVLRRTGLRPDLIHIDAGHDYDSVMADLRVWWHLLSPGGILIGDDYYTNGIWPAVKQAFDDFFRSVGMDAIENAAGKCWIEKGADAARR